MPQISLNPLENLKICSSIVLNVCIGIGFLSFLSLFLILSLPFYLYRWLICRFVAPHYRPELGEPLSPFGASYGAEYISKGFHSRASRCVMVSSTTVQGTLPFDSILDDLERKWIKAQEATDDGGAILRYPEFRQYIESWKGILFWKRDTNFKLENHVKLHKIDEGDTNSEEFVRSLIENLVNKPFPPKKSPWEVHIVHGYRNAGLFPPSNNNNQDSEDVDGDCEMTVFILRLHHALADGFSVMSLEIEGLLGLSLDNNDHFKKPRSPQHPQQRRQNPPLWRKWSSWIQLPLRMIYDSGYLIGLTLHPQMNSPWAVPDEKKKWEQFYARAPLIPVEKIAFVKRTLGVSFTSVLFSCMSAALADDLIGRDAEKFKKEVKYLPVTTALPLPRAPEERFRLRNRLTGTILEVPITPEFGPKERLDQCEACYTTAKRTTLPLFIQLFVTTLAPHLPLVSNFTFYNRMISVGLSNFPGPTFPAYWMGKRLLNTDVTVGGMPGIAGICVMVLSYGKHFRITVTAEKSVMSRKELDRFVNRICAEIHSLFELAKQVELQQSINSSDD